MYVPDESQAQPRLNMNEVISVLLRLQEAARCTRPRGPLTKRQIETLRTIIPSDVLRRFDHLVERGRAPVGFVSPAESCTGCHLRLPQGVALAIQRSDEVLHTCPHCGCFLCVAPLPVAIGVAEEASAEGIRQ